MDTSISLATLESGGVSVSLSDRLIDGSVPGNVVPLEKLGDTVSVADLIADWLLTAAAVRHLEWGRAA